MLPAARALKMFRDRGRMEGLWERIVASMFSKTAQRAFLCQGLATIRSHLGHWGWLVCMQRPVRSGKADSVPPRRWPANQTSVNQRNARKLNAPSMLLP